MVLSPDPVPDFLFTSVIGNNNAGILVGSVVSMDGLTRSGLIRSEDPCGLGGPGIISLGWVRKADAVVNYLQVDGASRTRARGINDHGSAVGFIDDTASGLSIGFKVELDGSPGQTVSVDRSDLLQVMEFDITFPEGISNSGNIVGIAGDFGAPSHGFIVTAH